MAQELSAAVLSNLEENKPIWLKTHTLAAIKERSALNLIIVSKREIRRLNKKWLGKDKVTDVLSFPLLDLRVDLRVLKMGDINGQVGPRELGEIFIAYEKAHEQALEYNHSIDRELAFLFVHGMLHILGFDHKDRSSEKDMFGRQKSILKQAGYPRLVEKLSQ
jgi:probable rRNA maturation factor